LGRQRVGSQFRWNSARSTDLDNDLASRLADLDRCDRIRGLAERSDILHVGIQFAVRDEGSDDLEDATPNMLRYASLVLLRTLIFEEFTGLVLTHGSGCPVREPSPITWK
jgi:hypothetical protein